MEIVKRTLVSCELTEGRMRTQVSGNLEDVLSLTTCLMASTATSTAKAGVIGLDSPEEIINAMCEAAIDVLKEQEDCKE